MFDERLSELERHKENELNKENPSKERLKGIQNQLELTLNAKTNKEWRYSH